MFSKTCQEDCDFFVSQSQQKMPAVTEEAFEMVMFYGQTLPYRKATGGGLGVMSQILLILAYVSSPTYLVSKMGSLFSQLPTVVEI